MNRRAPNGRGPHPVLLKQSALPPLVPADARLAGKRAAVPRQGGPDIAPPAQEAGPSLAAIREHNETLQRSLAKAEEALRLSAARHEQTLRDAREKSREEGYAEGQRQALDAWKIATDKLDAGIRQAREDFAAKLESLDALAVDIAAAAFEAVLSDPTYHAETLAAVVSAQFDRLSHENIIAIIVSPAGLPKPKDWLSSLQAGAPAGTEVRFDATLAAGSCEIQLATGSIDAGIATQLGNVRQALEGWK